MIRKSILMTLPLLVGALAMPLAQAQDAAVATDTVKAAPAAKKPARARHHRAPADTGSSVPTRGMSMAQVERRFGAPVDKLPAAGGDAPRHPTINRWRYAGYTVYFERNHVIHTVVDAANPTS
ncbi:MAG: hypothetical protein KF903_02830 [Dokdonella sp.]|uniref:hypothetical protein n=1 Tax=Dokdonella sp. TaxID=2291710 RepID=UPI0025C12214|nr:hypothetical protein [Dokdonella sp.]MBX3699919.1 hypothetical protein [Dokdonella sp.]MCW5579506.1 hypothetical protein [Dokdonella sp.]